MQAIKRHGGKAAFQGKLAKWIISLMPPRDGSWHRYVEPYFGGGAVLLNMDPEGLAEYANDLDGRLTNFWNVLQRKEQSDDLLRLLSVTPLSEIEFHSACDDHAPLVVAAAHFFIRNRQSRAAQGKDYVTPTSRLRRGMNEQVSAWLSAVDGLPEVVERMRRVEVWNRPALEVIECLDSEQAVFYLDPPYLHETRVTTSEYGELEMSEQDHEDLLVDLKNCTRARCLLSGYRSDLYDQILEDWTRHEFDIVNNASSKKTKDVKTECVWTNY